MDRFTGKYAIVTGGASGIGRATVLRMFEEGAEKIAIIDFNDDAMQQVIMETDAKRVSGYHCNLLESTDIKAAFEKINAVFPRIDILVNCAGGNKAASFLDSTEDEMDFCYKLNTKATYLCCKEVVDGMIKNKYGRIVNFSSGSEYGGRGNATYSAAKAGVTGLSRGMAADLAEYNITVNVILPGLVDTPILKVSGINEDMKEIFKQSIPLNRLGEPKELGATACFLASDDAGYITGEEILVNGGVMMV